MTVACPVNYHGNENIFFILYLSVDPVLSSSITHVGKGDIKTNHSFDDSHLSLSEASGAVELEVVQDPPVDTLVNWQMSGTFCSMGWGNLMARGSWGCNRRHQQWWRWEKGTPWGRMTHPGSFESEWYLNEAAERQRFVRSDICTKVCCCFSCGTFLSFLPSDCNSLTLWELQFISYYKMIKSIQLSCLMTWI